MDRSRSPIPRKVIARYRERASLKKVIGASTSANSMNGHTWNQDRRILPAYKYLVSSTREDGTQEPSLSLVVVFRGCMQCTHGWLIYREEVAEVVDIILINQIDRAVWTSLEGLRSAYQPPVVTANAWPHRAVPESPSTRRVQGAAKAHA
jgi:hypothetical protein